MRKLLVVGIIVLFIGVGVYPVIAVETNSSMVNNQDDCGCEDVSNIHLERIGSKLERLKGYTKSLLLLSKRNPVIYEKCLEVSDSINTITEKYEELSYYMDTLEWEYPIICTVYLWLYDKILNTLDICDAIIEYLEQLLPFGLLLSGFFAWVRVFLVIWGANVEVTLYGFGCWEP